MTVSDINFVFTIALKKELPGDVLDSCGIPVHTLAALKSGSLKNLTNLKTGVLVLVTGAGLQASKDAACWIRDNLEPCFVMNIGTSGIIDRKYNTGRWIMPETVSDENGCSVTACEEVQEPTGLISNPSLNLGDCLSNNNGSISLVPSGIASTWSTIWLTVCASRSVSWSGQRGMPARAYNSRR